MISPETRASLLLRLGDPANETAWAEFLEIYEPLLFRLASRWGLQAADAQEVVQETLLGVSKSIQSFGPVERKGAFRSWLATITRNKLVDHLSKRSRQEQGSGDTDVHHWLCEQAGETSSVSLWDIQQKQQVYRWAAEKVSSQVSETTWQAFERTAVDGEPVKQVADELGIREGMVYVARSRVMTRLRMVVQSWIQQDENHEV
ncbi:MAG: RNA polymerase sigma factor [Rubripirellula sp.]